MKHLAIITILLMGLNSIAFAQAAEDTTQLNAEIKKLPVLMNSGKTAEAIAFLDQLLPKISTAFGAGHRKTIGMLGLKASLHEKSGAYPLAIASYQTALQRLAIGQAPNPTIAGYLHNGVGTLFWNLGQIDSAAYHYQNALQYLEAAEGPNGKSLMMPRINLAMIKGAKGEIAEALTMLKQSLNQALLNGGQNQYGVAVIYTNMGTLQINQGAIKESLENFKQAALIMEKLYGPYSDNLPLILENIGTAELQLGNIPQYYSYNLRTLGIRQKHLPQDHPLVGRAISNVGTGKMLLGDFEEGLKLMNTGLDILKKGQDKVSVENLALAYQSLGVFYEQSGDIAKAMEYHTLSLEGFRKVYGMLNQNVANELSNLGGIHYLNGAQDEAILYYQQAAHIFQQLGGKQNHGFVKTMGNLGLVYMEKKQYDKVKTNFKLAAAHYQANATTPHSSDLISSYKHLSTLYQAINQLDSALYYINKVIEEEAQLYKTINPLLANSWVLKAGYLDKMARYDEAEKAYQQAITMYQALPLTVADLANAQLQLGWVYVHKQQYTSAKHLFELAKMTLDQNLEEHYEVLSLRSQLFAMNIFYSLGTWHAQTYLATKAKPSLDSSNTYLILAEAVAQSINRGQGDVFAKNAIKTSARSTNERLLDNYLLDPGGSLTLEQLFAFSERARSFLLYENIQARRAIDQLNLPDSILQQEAQLKTGISFLEQKQMEWISKGKDSKDSIYLNYAGKLFDLKQRQQQFKAKLTQNKSNYEQLNTQLRTTSISELQQLLAPQQTLLEYFVGDSNIYVFIVQKNQALLKAIKKDFPLEQWVKQLRYGLTAYHSTTAPPDTLYASTLQAYYRAADSLYHRLLAPAQSFFSPKLLIVPDGVLGYVPFEALLMQSPANPAKISTNNHYLGIEHQVAYSYSATLLRAMQQKEHKQTALNPFVAFAPYFDGDTLSFQKMASTDLRQSFDPLPNTGEEIYRIGKLMKGQLHLGKEASESRFLAEASKYRILHLATHGQANDQTGENGFLAFSPIKDSIENELLYVRDLYNLQLNADLVVLSACETGVGELQKGEGIVSLARAFAAAGAKSILTTLWSVNDASTKDLMVYFYKNLRKGLRKDEALWQAKREFLQANPGPIAHPFYWAAMISIGDMQKLNK